MDISLDDTGFPSPKVSNDEDLVEVLLFPLSCLREGRFSLAHISRGRDMASKSGATKRLSYLPSHATKYTHHRCRL